MLWHQVSIFLVKASLLKITKELSPQVTAITKYHTSYDSAFPLLISFSVMFTRSSHKGQTMFHTNMEYSLPDPIAMLSHKSTRSHRFVKGLVRIYLHTIYFWSYTNGHAFYCLEGYLSFWISFKCLYRFNASWQACHFLVFWNIFRVWRLKSWEIFITSNKGVDLLINVYLLVTGVNFVMNNALLCTLVFKLISQQFSQKWMC